MTSFGSGKRKRFDAGEIDENGKERPGFGFGYGGGNPYQGQGAGFEGFNFDFGAAQGAGKKDPDLTFSAKCSAAQQKTAAKTSFPTCADGRAKCRGKTLITI